MTYLTHDPIDRMAWQRRALDGRDGASVEFQGLIRREEEGIPIACLEYETYEPMAERVIARLVEQTRQRWPVHEVCVTHRFGRIPVGHLALFVGVRAAHRREAFEACQFLVDGIKREAPIWKTAIGSDGTRLNAPCVMDTPVTEPPTTTMASAAGRPQRALLNEQRLPIVGHLEELRKRLWGCVVVSTLASMISFAWADQLVEWLKRPAGPALSRFAFFSPPEAFLAYMKVAITAGLFLSAPMILAQVWAFISPGLTARERRYGCGFIWWGSLLFLAGGAFAYWVLLPLSLTFLLNFGRGQMEPVMSISQYLSFITMVILSCGLAFQLPLVMFVLARLGLVNSTMLRQQWRHAVVVVAVAAAILTPTTDIATMLLLAVPLLALYEISIWVTGCSASRRTSNG